MGMGPVVSAQTAVNAPNTALAASVVVAGARALYGGTVYNSKASAQYIQFFDSATLPADTAVPLFTIPVPAHSVATINYGLRGRAFAAGIVACNSSTDGAKTIGSSDCLFDLQYA